MLYMPPYLFYILQLFDIVCFGLLKRVYNTQVKGQMRFGISYIIKEDFLLIYYIAYTQAITKKNMLSSFSAIRFVPFNLEYILSTLSPII